MGILASQLGPEDPIIGPQIQPFIETLLRHFSRQLDSPEIREYSHSALTHVAGAIGERFCQYLPQAIPLALQSCQQDDGVDQGKEMLLGKGENGEGSLGAVGGSQEEDLQQQEEADEEGSDDDVEQHLRVRTGKSGGMTALSGQEPLTTLVKEARCAGACLGQASGHVMKAGGAPNYWA